MLRAIDGFVRSTDRAALAMDPSSAQQSVDRAARSEDAHTVVASTDSAARSTGSTYRAAPIRLRLFSLPIFNMSVGLPVISVGHFIFRQN